MSRRRNADGFTIDGAARAKSEPPPPPLASAAFEATTETSDSDRSQRKGVAKGMTVRDLFCGGGGVSAGFKDAGFTIACGADSVKEAIETFALNFPCANSIFGDLSDPEVSNRIVEAYRGKVGVVCGGPPCQGFSKLNVKALHGKYEGMNRLPILFAKMAVSLDPTFVLMEEVPSAKKHILDAVTATLEQGGYTVSHKVVDSSRHGVPQRRKRFILVACKGKIGFDFTSIATTEEVSVQDVLGQYPIPKMGAEVKEHVRKRILELDEKGAKQENFAVVDMQKPVRTIHTQISSQAGPYTIKRDGVYYEMSIQEAARLQSFPEWFRFLGESTNFDCRLVSTRRVIGNAVPPLLISRIAESLKRHFTVTNVQCTI